MSAYSEFSVDETYGMYCHRIPKCTCWFEGIDYAFSIFVGGEKCKKTCVFLHRKKILQTKTEQNIVHEQ